MKLLEPTTIGNHQLKNHMVMSAMTRSRADHEGVIGEMTVEYYLQRSGAGLILSEGINISKDAIGSPFTPGIFTQEQIKAWKKVTDTVHNAGGVIFAQLWHTGRIGHSADRDGVLPVAPSAIAIPDGQHFTSKGMLGYEVPRALTTEEVYTTIEDYRQAAINAMEAGFDGVELHGANGYLPHEFLSESANKREDHFGGTIENKIRFVVEVMKVLIDAVGGERVGIKLSPLHPYGGIVFDNPVNTYTALFKELNKLDFAFVELMKRGPSSPLLPGYPNADEIDLFGHLPKHLVIANMSYDKKSAEAELKKGVAKLISFGALFIANPDLPERFKRNADLNEPDRNTFFGGDENGYTDYPFLDAE